MNYVLMIFVVSWKEKMNQKVILAFQKVNFSLIVAAVVPMIIVINNFLTVSLDNSLQNISSHTPEHYFHWTKWDDNQADEDMCGKPLFSGVAGICVHTTSFKCFSSAML